jgi:hypothetical protein
MKQTLSSQEYNELFKNARDTFDAEMAKRTVALNNMGKKLEIIECANEFIELELMNSTFTKDISSSQVAVFNANNLGGSYNQYGATVHPKFKNEPIDIFNLKLTSGNTMFKNSLSCTTSLENTKKVNEDEAPITVEDDSYVNLIMSDNSLEKEIIFNKLTRDKITLSYVLDNTIALGAARFNVIEIDPYLYGAYSIESINIYSLNQVDGTISTEPIASIGTIENIGKIRVILDDKVKFSKVDITFRINFNIVENNINKYPFGLKHIYFYEADFIDDSYVILPIRANDYFEYIQNDIIMYQGGSKIETTCDYYNIELYTDYVNDTLTGRVYTSSDAQSNRITKNTKVLYAKIPLIFNNKVLGVKKYLSLTGVLFNYITDENYFL